jgi:transposase
MPHERLSMRKIREVLRLRWEQGLSHRQIMASCKIGLGTVGEYLRRASAAGLTWPLPAGLTDDELELRLFPPPEVLSPPERPLPDWAEVHQELRKKGVTLLLLWQEYQAGNPTAFRYSRFCELYQEWRSAAEPRMRQVHKAGEKLFVDYAGLTAAVTDRSTGECRAASIFVASLGASSYIYAEATGSQTLPDWIGSHVRTFAHLGGVPALIVPDNLKTGVTAACYYEPDLNPTYQELARHYGTAILPARVRKPRDKGKVENAVQQVERWVLAPLRHHTFFSLAELNAALRETLQALNDRPGPGLPASRRELFESLDRPALKPLPVQPYALALWKKARVHLDYHVQVDYHFYSVPHRLVRQEVEIRLTATVVEIFHGGQRVASHLRSAQKYGFTTLPEHMPPGHRAYAERDAQQLLHRAREYGAATEALFRKILASRRHPELGYRSCLGILRLGQVHGAPRLEQACQQALQTGGFSYRSVQELLRRSQEEPPASTALEESPPSAPLHHANIRGADYYRQQEETQSC